MRPRSVVVVAALIVAPLARVLSQRAPAGVRDTALPTYRLRLLGVLDGETGQGIEGADVIDLATGASSATNRSGLVSLVFLPDGGALVRIRKVGYTPVSRFIGISPSDTTPVTELLAPLVQTLPVVTRTDSGKKYISPGLQGFEQRRHEGFGHFIGEDVLRKSENELLSSVIVAHVPGLVAQPGAFGARYLASTRKPCVGKAFSVCISPNCWATVYLDGALVYSATSASTAPPPDFARMVPVRDLAGVEFYAGGASVPVQYNATDSGCGVLLLWTRER